MKLLINTNPYISKRYIVESIDSTHTMEAQSYELDIDPDTISSTGIYKIFDQSYKLLYSAGGYGTKLYSQILSRENIHSDLISIRDELKEKIEIKSSTSSLKLSTSSQRITSRELDKIYINFIENLQFASYVQLLNKTTDQYRTMIDKSFINICNKSEVMVGTVLSEDNIKGLLPLNPTIVVTTKSALESYGDRTIYKDFEISKIAKEILNEDLRYILYLSDSGQLVLYTKDKNYRIIEDYREKEKCDLNKVLAGFIVSLSKNYSMEMALKVGYSCGIASIDRSEFNKDAGEIKELINTLKVEDFNVWR